MKTFKYIILFSFLVHLCFAQSNPKEYLTHNEIEYLTVRDRYIRYFNNIAAKKEITDKISKQHDDSLIDLEKRLRVILKDCPMSDMPKNGKINLEALFPDMGFGALDGLTVSKDSMRIFCTSKNLFFDYFKKEKITRLDNLTSKQIENIFNSVFNDDAYISNFSYYKIPEKNQIKAYGMVGGVSQGIGSLLPQYVYVFVADNHFVYMVEKQLNDSVQQIPKCKSIWESIFSESQKADSVYRISNLKDTASFNTSIHMEELAFDKYCSCYQTELKKERQFEEIQKQIEKIVQYIMLSK